MERILFIDGVCVMCNGLMNFIIKHDKKKLIIFSTLQGETAKKVIPKNYLESLSTVIFLENNKIYSESDAILRVLILLGGFFKIFKIFFIFPKKFRDYFYKLISKNRYKLFGKKEFCRLLTKEDHNRILP